VLWLAAENNFNMEVHYSTSGFMKDAAYTAHLYGILKDYDGKFIGLETLNLELKEILPDNAGMNKKAINFSEDKKTCTIKLEEFQYRNQKGKITSQPSPQSVFTTVRFVLDKAVKEYAELP
jgi:hypothetical protein